MKREGIMKLGKSILTSGLAVLSFSAFGQANSTRLVQLHKDLPVGLLNSISFGAKPSTDKLNLSLSLKPKDSTGFQQFVDSVSDPVSPKYHHFLKPEEVGSRFGVSNQDLQKVTNYLVNQGFTIRRIGKNHMSLLVEGTVGQAQKAFNTTIEQFLPVGQAALMNNARYSYTTSPELPASIAGMVQNVGGLENFTKPKFRTSMTPTQLRTIYGVAGHYGSGNHGEGRTIGISNWDGFRLGNVPLFVSAFGLPSPAGGVGSNVSVQTISGGAGSGQAHGEGDLDIQAALGMAPLASIVVYDGGNGDLIGVLTQEVDDNVADVITESYGWHLDKATAGAAHDLHLAMSAQGITYMAASGDSGTDLGGYYYPAIDPEVLSIGGTSVSVDSSNNRKAEVVWSNSSGAGGGGWSATSEPFNVHASYQTGTGVPTAAANPYRVFPDVSLDADPYTGYFVYYQGTKYAFGGTSASSPTFAAALVGAEQKLVSLGALSADSNGHYRFGRIQDLLYSYNGDASVFFDITSGNNGILPNGKTSNATKGWDTASGWGAMSFSGFIAKVAKIQTGISSVSLSPSSIEGGSTAPVTGTVTLSSAAPNGGLAVTLKSSDASVTVPSSLTIVSGKTTGTFKVTTKTVSQTISVSITAASGSKSAFGTLTVLSPNTTALSVSPTSVNAGSVSVGTVTIDKAAPSGGVVVNLSSDNSAASVPGTVKVASGQTTAKFNIDTNGVASSTTVHVTAAAGGKSKSASLTIKPSSLSSLTLNKSSVYADATITGTIKLTGPAPAGGTSVALSVSHSALSIGSSVTVPAGQSSTTFTATSNPVKSSVSVTVKGSFSGTSKTDTVTVLPPVIASITIDRSSALGGVDKPNVTITLNSTAASAGVIVAVSSSNSAAADFPFNNVTIAGGQKSRTVALPTFAVSSDKSVTITGTTNGSKDTCKVTVKAADIVSFSVSPSSIKGGSAAKGTITLNGPAGPSGRVVSLKSSNTSVAPVASSVTVPAGKSSVTFPIATKKVTSNKTVTITATLDGISKTDTFVVTK